MRIGWFSTGRDAAARDLLREAHKGMSDGFIQAEIAFVFCSRERGESPESDRFLDLAKGLGLEVVTLSARKFEPALRRKDLEAWRELYHSRLADLISPYKAELIMLAGYMLIVSPGMCRTHTMINLHPALPGGPTGTWQDVIWCLIEEGAERTGAMIHIVTEELDRGPVVTYCSFPIRGPSFDPLWEAKRGRSVKELKAQEGEKLPLFQLIRAEEVKREIPLIVITLKALAEERVRVEGRRVLDARGVELPRGLDLSGEVEEYLRRRR